MRNLLVTILIVISLFISGFTGWYLGKSSLKSVSTTNFSLVKSHPLEKYTIENLSKTNILPGQFRIKEIMADEEKFTAYLFEFTFIPDITGKQTKTTTGQINIPNSRFVTCPGCVILMLRGYVDQELYQTGDGTKKAAQYFAENGYITIAPDFLGYAGADKEAENIFESRFQTYVTVLSLLKTLESLEDDPELILGSSPLTNQLTNQLTLFLWGHSNGGQIALTVLEITGKKYPTVLWAPVSKPFPYSILYYTDESEDGGKLIRKELAKFEDIYNADLYSLTNYLDRIKAPIQLHQGTADDTVPVSWSNNLYNILLDSNIDINLYLYTGADHNLQPNWETVVTRDLDFFTKHYN